MFDANRLLAALLLVGAVALGAPASLLLGDAAWLGWQAADCAPAGSEACGAAFSMVSAFLQLGLPAGFAALLAYVVWHRLSRGASEPGGANEDVVTLTAAERRSRERLENLLAGERPLAASETPPNGRV